MKHKSWTGGTVPESIEDMGPACYAYSLELYRAAVSEYRKFWGEDPDHATSAILSNRAKLDAWATYHQN